VQVWGLTGWILDVMLRRFGVWPTDKHVRQDVNSHL
jgi:hypothetical protein